MFHKVFCAPAETGPSNGLAKFLGAPDRTDIGCAMLMGEGTSRQGQPSITFGDGDRAMLRVPFITDCNKASVS
jgi:hypothetical protein